MKYSILITVYNKEKYIERCIDSACNQTLKNFEVIVVNDGSTDNSHEIIKKKQKEYKFKYYDKENTGAADTRNFIIDKVKTPYFLFIDADDYLELDCLEKLDKYSEEDYDLLSFNATFYNENHKFKKNITKPPFKGKGEDFYKLVWQLELHMVPWGLIYKTSYFKEKGFKYNKGYLLDDFCVTPFVILSAKTVISVDYKGYNYFEVPNSIMTKKGNDEIMFKTYEHFFDMLIEQNEKGTYSQKAKDLYHYALITTMIWVGDNYKGKEQREYIKRLKERHILDFLKEYSITGKIIYFLMNINMYYKIKKILKPIKPLIKMASKLYKKIIKK